jgi:NTP pyrophosphatase (non-canonical NTP hydrolase)
MGEIAELTKNIVKFRDDRNWAQFHNGKDLAICLSVEASELLELFLWKKDEEVNIENLKDELADVMNCALLLAEKYKLNVKEIMTAKLKKNAIKYPVEKAKNSKKKYNELH